jgi:hypothetical protein
VQRQTSLFDDDNAEEPRLEGTGKAALISYYESCLRYYTGARNLSNLAKIAKQYSDLLETLPVEETVISEELYY